MNNVIPVILCGGNGTRLWPKSRKATPKQFQKILGDNSMFQETLARVGHLGRPIVITNEAHRFEVAAQLEEINVDAQIVIEPMGRNTAPAIAVAADMINQQDNRATMVVLPSDHLIGNQDAFKRAMDLAVRSSKYERHVTFGIKPDRPETGYGYIKLNSETSLSAPVEKFVEKPDLETARRYLEEGGYLWNSGMFVFDNPTLISELEGYQPALMEKAKLALTMADHDRDFIYLDADAFAQCEDISIDYALMELTNKASCVTLDAHWNDLGGWAAVWQESPQDENENALSGDIKAMDTKRCLIDGRHRLVATIGVEDLIVVDTTDSLLIAHRDQAHKVKDIVSALDIEGRSEHVNQAEVKRPWGTYESIDQGDRHQVKHIVVKPGESLSKQMHHHRAEHWIVVSGVALVEIDNEEQMLAENQSCFIPTGAVHRLTNPGKVDLHLIEVQSGSYLGEDDIVRFEDIYGRVA